MGRFVVFTHNKVDIEDYRREFSEHEFVFISYRGIHPDAIVISDKNLEEIFEGMERSHRTRPFHGVLFGYLPEIYVLVAEQLIKRLGLPRSIGEAKLARDKYLMRKALSARVKCPPCILIRNLDDLQNSKDIDFPCVLKPRFGYGSICVIKVHNRRELEKEYREKKANIEQMANDNPLGLVSADFLLESYIGGTEHTIDSFVEDSEVVFQAISDKLPMTPPYFVEVGDVMPSRLSAQNKEDIRRSVQEAVCALGIERGWTHAEVKLVNDSLYFMEVAARNGGGYFRDLVRIAYGIDMRQVLIDSYLGRHFNMPTQPRKTVIGNKIVAYGISLVWNVTGLKKLRHKDYFKEFIQKLPDNGLSIYLGPPYSYNNTLMSFLIIQPSYEEALAKTREANEALGIHRISILKNSKYFYAIFSRVSNILVRLPRINSAISRMLNLA